jgi:hypothetical protein
VSAEILCRVVGTMRISSSMVCGRNQAKPTKSARETRRAAPQLGGTAPQGRFPTFPRLAGSATPVMRAGKY